MNRRRARESKCQTIEAMSLAIDSVVSGEPGPQPCSPYMAVTACSGITVTSCRSASSTGRPPLVGFQKSATGPDLGFYAVRPYSLMRPRRTGGAGSVPGRGPRQGGRAGAGGAGGCDGVAVRCSGPRTGPGPAADAVRRRQHPVGDLGSDGEHEPFRKSIRSRAAGRDLHGLNTGAGQDCVKRCGELPGPITDQEPEPGGPVPQIHYEVPVGTLGARTTENGVVVDGARRAAYRGRDRTRGHLGARRRHPAAGRRRRPAPAARWRGTV